jgi:hypothetical protein
VSWSGLALAASGTAAGVVAGVLFENPLRTALQRLFVTPHRRRKHRSINKAWEGLEQLYPALRLVQAGWDEHGYFAEGTAVLRLGGEFRLTSQLAGKMRTPHEAKWHQQGQQDNWQVGINAIRISRISEEPSGIATGRNHLLLLTAHSFRYFDFLATHRLRLSGTADEQAQLNAIAGSPHPEEPVGDFPNPCSVGVSVLCEDGAKLILARRTHRVASGGDWMAGKLYNPVGETVCPHDFSALFSHEATPDVVAKRGLHQEMGFTKLDIDQSPPRIHSLAWAADLLDHKFFGLVTTSLSEAEVTERWRAAQDAREADPTGLVSYPIHSPGARRALLASIRDNPTDWAPETLFCTIRSLTVLGQISPRTIEQVFG